MKIGKIRSPGKKYLRRSGSAPVRCRYFFCFSKKLRKHRQEGEAMAVVMKAKPAAEAVYASVRERMR